MLHLPITRSWMVSRAARRFYTVCAFCAIGLIWMRVIILMFLTVTTLDLSNTSLAFICLAPFVVIGWLAVSTIWVAMWYFWLSFDKNSPNKKLGWFIALMLPPLGTLAYFFAVCYRSQYFQSRRFLSEYEKIDPAEERAFAELPGPEY